MNNHQAILLLAHQGKSYLPMILQALEKFGVRCLVLSSRPSDPADLDNLRACGPDAVWDVEEDYLNTAHVDMAIGRARDEGYAILGAIATFEGYRVLMAETNLRLQAIDAAPAAVVHAMDKYLCRGTLAEHGLSRSRADIITPESIDALKASGRTLFVKPRRGAGSFACFPLDETFNAAKLADLQRQMREDLAFRAIFAGQFDFIAEDCIPGDEYSFEVLVAGGESFVIGVHAKYLDQSTGIALETSNSCPAPRLPDAAQRAGEVFIDDCLARLGLTEGCYHIEARHNPADGRWDIIEINLRMGGALINESIGLFTGGASILELWLQALCSRSPEQREAYRARLSALRESTRRAAGAIEHGTVFFSRYGQRNRLLEHISVDGMQRPPDICKILVKPGTRLPDAERGIFIVNALWKVQIDDIGQELGALSAMLDDKLVVRYAAEA